MLLFAGEPGIGKTRLLTEAARAASGHGLCPVLGGCQRRDMQESYAPVTAALVELLERQSTVRRRAVLDGCGWLVRLLPELAAWSPVPTPIWTLAPDQERRLLFNAVARLLANAAGLRGTLLVLDDLQWAGSDTFDLLSMLVRSAKTPLRIVGAFRDGEVSAQHPLAALMADLGKDGLVLHRTLGPLSMEEVEQLLDAIHFPSAERLREQVWRRGGECPSSW